MNYKNQWEANGAKHSYYDGGNIIERNDDDN